MQEPGLHPRPGEPVPGGSQGAHTLTSTPPECTAALRSGGRPYRRGGVRTRGVEMSVILTDL